MEIESMTNIVCDADDLKTLQREADELRESRGKNNSTVESVSQTLQDHEGEQCKQESSTESVLLELADQIELYLKETGAAVQDRPVVSLLAAFALGVVVGQFFSRK